MPLTQEERQFLDAYVYEATSGPPFGGPATNELSRRGIWYPDLSWILTAYQRELSAEGRVPMGVHNPNPPQIPWEDLQIVKLRNQDLKEELQSLDAVLQAGPLSPLQQTTEIRDAQGHLLGIFTPQAVAEEERLKSLFDLDEAEHVLATERHTGRPLQEIWRDLQR